MALHEPETENVWWSGCDEEGEDEFEDEIRANLEFDFWNIDINPEESPSDIRGNDGQLNDQDHPENEPE